MGERITLSLHISDANAQTRAFRSQSFNNPPTLSTHRSRRTLSLPAREKPAIPPPISETPEDSRLDDEMHPPEQQPIQSYSENCHDEMRKYIHSKTRWTLSYLQIYMMLKRNIHYFNAKNQANLLTILF